MPISTVPSRLPAFELPVPLLRRLLNRNRPAAPAGEAHAGRPTKRLELAVEPDRAYAIGDVHGCIDKLRRLEAAIVADCAGFAGSVLVVCLGDYIDRGPGSAEVIEHLMAPAPAGISRVCLLGNHEDYLLDILDGSSRLGAWLDFGGAATLRSYGYDWRDRSRTIAGSQSEDVELLRMLLPGAHLEFLRGLPVALSTPTLFFAHAGARPGIPLADQTRRDLLWSRHGGTGPDPSFEKLVVHGHTPSAAPTVASRRIGIDTGAYMGGPLTAVRLEAGAFAFLACP